MTKRLKVSVVKYFPDYIEILHIKRTSFKIKRWNKVENELLFLFVMLIRWSVPDAKVRRAFGPSMGVYEKVQKYSERNRDQPN